MTGLLLARTFYEDVASCALQEAFPSLFHRMAIGLAGEGSECFGFDDALSRDHDWGTALCIWLDRDDYLHYGDEVQALYDALPKTICGISPPEERNESQGRRGCLCLQDWYTSYTARETGTESVEE